MLNYKGKSMNRWFRYWVELPVNYWYRNGDLNLGLWRRMFGILKWYIKLSKAPENLEDLKKCELKSKYGYAPKDLL